MSKEKTEMRDMGTAELGRQFRIVPMYVDGPMDGLKATVVDETAMDRLLLADRITGPEHGLLNHFLKKLHKANIGTIRSPSLEAPVQSDATIIADRRANMIRSVVRMFEKLDEAIGKGKRMALVNLVLMDMEWPGDDETLKGAIAALQDCLR